MTVIFWQSNTR